MNHNQSQIIEPKEFNMQKVDLSNIIIEVLYVILENVNFHDLLDDINFMKDPNQSQVISPQNNSFVMVNEQNTSGQG